MPAQGHTILDTSDVIMKTADGREFPTKRLRSTQLLKNPQSGAVEAEFKCVSYYFFVGHEKITNDHLQRTLVDMKDRLIYGRDQRWAYVSASMWYGKIPWIKDREVTEKEADEKLKDFITQFAERQIDWSQLQK
jgi:hypothetical protein